MWFGSYRSRSCSSCNVGPPIVASKAAVYVHDEAGYVKIRDWCRHLRLHQCGHQALYQTWLSLKPPPPAGSGSKPRLISPATPAATLAAKPIITRILRNVTRLEGIVVSKPDPLVARKFPTHLLPFQQPFIPFTLQVVEPVEGSDVLVVSVWLSVDREISGYAQSRDTDRLHSRSLYLVM